MKQLVYRKEIAALAILACAGLLFFPIGFLWFGRKRDRIPGALLAGIFSAILLVVFETFFCLIYPETRGWYNALLAGGGLTAIFLLTRRGHFGKSSLRQVKLVLYLCAVQMSFTLCLLYLIRLRLFGLKFSFLVPIIFVGGPFIWASLVAYAYKNYPSPISTLKQTVKVSDR